MRKRVRIVVVGRVQGVGFRPTVYRHAAACAVSGFVRNDPAGVVVEAEGGEDAIGKFLDLVRLHPPEPAEVRGLTVEEIAPTGETAFRIVPSRVSGSMEVRLPPDFATCDHCVAELFDSANRRHRYPFTNCTCCGPRFTIARSLPYDRERTSMAGFRMCARCAQEYSEPADRRFDTQPNACPDCGPKLSLVDPLGRQVAGEPIRETAVRLIEGAIVAVKGLGGYHLCCDASSDAAVRRLRDRKRRPHKALAVMFGSVAAIETCCLVSEAERCELCSRARPIIILRRRTGAGLSAHISPDTRDVGVFLPYTPVHHLLLAETGRPLVMTSGNAADEPIAFDEEELKPILGRVADFALAHDRPIVRRCDDSVLRLVGNERLFLRRSRGFVPDPIPLPVSGPTVLACGADLKNTFCLTRGNTAVVSQHIGDLADYRAWEFYREAIADLEHLMDAQPEIIAHDLHPDYVSTRHAEDWGGKTLVAVQHHHAHVAACMAEHRLTGPVIGVALDGAGLGNDGTPWGGEFLVADLLSIRRVFHFKPYPLPGGDEAVRQPARMALSCLVCDTDAGERTVSALLPGLAPAEISGLKHMIARKLRSPPTSSAGRLFDAVSAMLGLCSEVTYEGQAAIRLQAAASPDVCDAYPCEIREPVVDFGPMIRNIVADILARSDRARIAGMFHNTLAAAAADVCERIRAATGLGQVALSGGVFQNDLLLQRLTGLLRERNFEVYSHRLLPPNDACICLGQAAVALAQTARARQ